ncbi:uncharacterized protein [Watersipora subatra]|uniref:uncharacterized protein n=1 Tax=Watersipora subatra TaxID=2589382 RepID=UPI00355B1442
MSLVGASETKFLHCKTHQRGAASIAEYNTSSSVCCAGFCVTSRKGDCKAYEYDDQQNICKLYAAPLAANQNHHEVLTTTLIYEVRELQGFLGTVGYYRRHILEFAILAHPLHRLTAKGKPWKWVEGKQAAFNTLKESISTALTIGYQNLQRQYTLDTDASGCGVMAMLSQVQEDCEKPYLYGQEFLLRTDHASLWELCLRRKHANQIARWLEILVEFCYILEHRSRTGHRNADGLSRQTCKDCRQCARTEQRKEGPSRKELTREQGLLAAAWVPEVPRGQSAPPGATGPKGELAKTQATGKAPVAIKYSAIAPRDEVPAEHLELGSRELDIQHYMWGSPRIRQDRVLKARKVEVDLVGSFPVTPEENKWVLVLTNHSIWWQEALALPEATAPVVANALDEQDFCYLKLSMQIHTDQEAQFESQLMAELCPL